MTDRVIEWSARNPVLVLLLTSAAVVAGWWSVQRMPLDALPDLSETQVIVNARWDRSPDIIEDQVTYPIVTAMLGAPRVKDVRGISDFGASYIYVVFDEGTDLYWARSRTLEYLARALPHIPSEVKTELGPDATGLGWVFQYALVDTTHTHNLAQLRSIQDWYLRYHLSAVQGVAEVASLGGFVRQYQINVNPDRLRELNIPIAKAIAAVRAGNNDIGGRLIELGGREYMVRGRGYIHSVQDIEEIGLGVGSNGVPIRVRDVASVVLGPELRRGVSDLDGKGQTVCGIVVMRHGENALRVIDRVKARLKDIERGLPAGVKVLTTYDRSELILGSVSNLTWTICEELAVVALIILLFLWHFPSAVIPIVTIPVAVLVAFVPIGLTGMTANIMSLGGIAIAIGAMVDASIVVVEQSHKRLERWQKSDGSQDFRSVIIQALQEVGGASFFSLLVIAAAFLPVLALEAQEGKLFKPLAITKSLAMIAAAVLAITLDPALRLLFTRVKGFHFKPRWARRVANGIFIGRIREEERHPVSRALIRLYVPVVRWSLRRRWIVITGALTLVLITIPVYRRLGSEFMPSLDEGSILFMPVTMPGITLNEARRLMQAQDRVLASFPEVARVTGKAGRADTATDPAPPSMIETVILLKPKEQWPKIATWYSGFPAWLHPAFRHITPDHESTADLVARMDEALHIPGVSNAWTMPIRARIQMQATGIRTAVGVKITGPDPVVIQSIGEQIESVLRSAPGTRGVFAERTGGGYFLDINLKREQLARYGLNVEDAGTIVANAIGGDDVTMVFAGRERYPVSIRYPQDARSGIPELERISVPIMDGSRSVPLRDISDIRQAQGPAMLRDENGLLTGYVYADVAAADIGHYVSQAKSLVDTGIKLPPGYATNWSGEFEAMARVGERLKVILPLTAFVIVLLLYWNTKSLTRTAMVLLAVPFSAIGGIWLLAALGYNLSVAVWIGLIALMGVDAETGVFMLLYLDLAFEERSRAGMLRDHRDLREAIVEGAAGRIRPKFMTVSAMFLSLVPMLWSNGPGADVMKHIAAPMAGGIVTSFILELVVYPALYDLWRTRSNSAWSRPA
ncbi:MAG: efflux RND transporter permease subunit [Acidobacteriaceae bacterium]|nr:efflux RND transporter permease subunit [Acidobacteriaceae bacterium]